MSISLSLKFGGFFCLFFFARLVIPTQAVAGETGERATDTGGGFCDLITLMKGFHTYLCSAPSFPLLVYKILESSVESQVGLSCRTVGTWTEYETDEPRAGKDMLWQHMACMLNVQAKSIHSMGNVNDSSLYLFVCQWDSLQELFHGTAQTGQKTVSDFSTVLWRSGILFLVPLGTILLSMYLITYRHYMGFR